MAEGDVAPPISCSILFREAPSNEKQVGAAVPDACVGLGGVGLGRHQTLPAVIEIKVRFF